MDRNVWAKFKHEAIRLLILLTAFTGPFLCPTSEAYATQTINWNAPDGTIGWCTAVSAGNTACYADPDAACRAQYQIYAGPSEYYGYTDSDYWNSKLCNWKYVVGYSLPATVSTGCNTGYTAELGPRGMYCTAEDFSNKLCTSSKGSQPNPWTKHPINLLTGAKRFDVTDFLTEDGAFNLRRTFVSRPYGGLTPTAALTSDPAFANWMSFFDVSLQMAQQWDGSGVITLTDADGTAKKFSRQTDGSYKTFTEYGHGYADTDGALQLVTTWPGSYSAVVNQTTQWLFTDRYNNVWTLQTQLDPISGKYRIARPISEQRPDGTVLSFTYDASNQLTTITDQAGKSISLTWNLRKMTATVSRPDTIATITLPGSFSLRYSYETTAGISTTTMAARLKKVEYLDNLAVVKDSVSYQYTDTRFPTYVTGILDSAGATRWKVTYDSQGRATRSEGPNGEFLDAISYSAPGTSFSRTQTDALGRPTVYNFTRDPGDWTAKLVSVQGQATAHCVASSVANTFDANTFVATGTDEEGRVTSYTRNTLGQPTAVTEAYGTTFARTTNVTWNSSYNLPSQTVEAGLTTNYTYDSQGRLTVLSMVDTTSQSIPYSTNGQTRTWTYTWGTTGGAKGKLVSIDGPLAGTGDTKTFTYNASGYLATVTDEVGKVTTVTSWDWRGAPLAVTDPNGVSTTLTYDVHGRPLTTTVNPGASQSQSSYSYDIYGNVTQIALPKGGYLQYIYDSASRLTQIKNDKNETITLTPNAIGDPTLSVTKDAAATITEQMATVYDELGRLIQTLGSASVTPTNLTYDKVSNLKTVVDGRGKTTSNTFDALNRVTQVSNPESQTVKLAYNAKDQVTSHKDGRNLETTFITNGFGDAIQEVSPDRGTRTYWYDLAGRMTKLVDGDSEETDFSYDNADRILTMTFPGAAGEAVTYTYDSTAAGNKGNARLTSVTEQSGSTALTYDAQGNVTKDAKNIQGAAYNVQYAYDTNGGITQVTLPSGRIITYTRDNDGLITGITTKPTAAGTVSTIASSMTYLPFGPLKALTYGNGLTLTRTYNANAWLSRIQVKNGASALFDLGYQYYDDGNLGEIDDNIATGRTTYIALTDSGRLSYAAGPWGQESFSWDAAGNRIGDYLTVGGITVTTNEITWGASNRLALTNDQNAVTKRTLQWRLGGDLYSDAAAGGSTYVYLYNARKRLVQINLNGALSATYGYDFKDQRVWRTVQTGATSWDIHYIFDQDGHLLAEHNGYTGAVIREYIWADDMPIAVIDISSGTATTYYIHTGHLNEPQVMTNAAKAKVWDAYVTPFGSAKVFTTATANVDIRLPGQWYQAEAAGSGLNQNGYRDYDPTLGRYIEADPLGIAAGQNPYTYVDGRPYDSIDPAGLEVRVDSRDPKMVQQMQRTYARLKRLSKHASKLGQALEAAPTVYRIKYAKGQARFCNPRSPAVGICVGNPYVIFIDPCFNPDVPTTAGDQASPFIIVLGHELGHAYANLKGTPGEWDDGPDQMSNVNANENPIRRDLGLPLRTGYNPNPIITIRAHRHKK